MNLEIYHQFGNTGNGTNVFVREKKKLSRTCINYINIGGFFILLPPAYMMSRIFDPHPNKIKKSVLNHFVGQVEKHRQLCNTVLNYYIILIIISNMAYM